MNYKRLALFTGIILIIFIIFNYLTRSCGHTSPVSVTVSGTNNSSGIAVLKPYRIGGVDQWLLIRGENTNNPVLLFLAGGPGLSELAWLRRYNSGLEKYFILVNWDHRGAGKSFEAFNKDTNISFQTYLSDTLEVIDLLRKEFHQDRIYLAGHGFGSLLGIYTARDHPEKLRAYIGISQMVAPAENDQLCYREIMQRARQLKNTNAINELKIIGMPPYSGTNFNDSYAILNGWINRLNPPRPFTNDYMTNWLKVVIATPEYSSGDRKNFWPSYFKVFSAIYPEMNRLDIRRDIRKLNVPVFFISGKYDKSSDPRLTRDFFQKLTASEKGFAMFDQSGNSPNYEENEKFLFYMKRTVLKIDE